MGAVSDVIIETISLVSVFMRSVIMGAVSNVIMETTS